MRKTIGPWVCLDWCDGPLNEIALVTYEDGKNLIEMKTHGGWVGEEYRVGMDGKKYFYNHMRFSREDLQAMLDLFDGKPVKDFHDPDQ